MKRKSEQKAVALGIDWLISPSNGRPADDLRERNRLIKAQQMGRKTQDDEWMRDLDRAEREVMLRAQKRFLKWAAEVWLWRAETEQATGQPLAHDGPAFSALCKAVEGLQTALRHFAPYGPTLTNLTQLLASLRDTRWPIATSQGEHELQQLQAFLPHLGLAAKPFAWDGRGSKPKYLAHDWVSMVALEWATDGAMTSPVGHGENSRFWKALNVFQHCGRVCDPYVPRVGRDLVGEALAEWKQLPAYFDASKHPSDRDAAAQ